MVTPMTATEEETRGAAQVSLPHEEVEVLRALLRRNDVAEMDTLAFLKMESKSGRAIGPPMRSARRGSIATL